MKVILTAKAAKANDLYTIHSCNIPEPRLISAAASAVLDALQTGGYDLRNPMILCGCGNNGADGFALACMLKESSSNVKVLYLGKLDAQGAPDTAHMSEQCLLHYQKALDADVVVWTALSEELQFSVCVDAVYGTGMRGAITDERVYEVFDLINACKTPVVAIDVPSGVNCTTGEADAHTLRAVQTVTVQHHKAGLLLYPGADYAGKITLADIGIEADPDYPSDEIFAIEDSDLDALLPARPARSHKGTFGRVLVVGGAPGMAGAVYLAAMAAYRSGAGLVEILTHADNRIILQQLIPEAVMTCYTDASTLDAALAAALPRANAIVLGCGIGSSAFAKQCVDFLLQHASVPLVVDADALNIISAQPALLQSVSDAQKQRTVITPHPAEAARLLGNEATAQSVTRNVTAAAEQLCDAYGTNVLLKDAHTLILAHDKSTRYINLSGSTALAGAGSGDILAGCIGGLCAAETNKQPVATTAALAAYLHGKAGERAEETVGARAAMARDILQELKK